MRPCAVIIPYHRPDLSGHVANQLCRQVTKPDLAIVVGNGKALGGLAPADIERLESAGVKVINVPCPLQHQSHARNLGLVRADAEGARLIVTMDSDDHYGPHFLQGLLMVWKDSTIVGKRPHLVIDEQGMFQVMHEPQGGRVPWLTGAAQAYGIEVARELKYPVAPTGEDVMFCLLARRLGIYSYDTGPNDYVYERRGAEHAFGRDVRKYMARFCKLVPTELNLPWVTDRAPGL